MYNNINQIKKKKLIQYKDLIKETNIRIQMRRDQKGVKFKKSDILSSFERRITKFNILSAVQDTSSI